MKRATYVEKGFLVAIVEKLLKVFAFGSAYQWLVWLMRKTKKWSHDELIPFWFAEAYTTSFLVSLGILFWLAPVRTLLWSIGAALAAYRLFDLAQGLASIVVFEPQMRRDEQGGHILARNSTRWLLITLLNLCEVVLCFSFFYLKWGGMFNPSILTRISAIYQSMSVFVAGSWASPIDDFARIITMMNLGYFVFFLVVIAPMIFSLIRAKERTLEKLGETSKR